MTQAYYGKEPCKADLDKWFYYENGRVFWKKNTARTKSGDEAGGFEKDGYRRVRFKGRKLYVHRLVWIMHTDNHPDLIDHIDGNRSNNLFENLRPATKSLNAINSKNFVSNKSTGIKGVHKSGNKYVARLWVNGERLSLGSFDTVAEARKTYQDAVATCFDLGRNPHT